jgi:hypothetical protein
MSRITLWLSVLFPLLAACQVEEKTSTAVVRAPAQPVLQSIRAAVVEDPTTVKVSFRVFLEESLEASAKWKVSPDLTVSGVENIPRAGQRTPHYLVKVSPAMRHGVQYRLEIDGIMAVFIDPAGCPCMGDTELKPGAK